MPQLSFPYLPDVYTDPDTQAVGYLYRPYVPLKLGAQGNTPNLGAECLLDTGADHNLFPAAIGQALGIHIERGSLITHGGIGGVVIRAYRHTVTFLVDGYRFDSSVDFSYDHQLPILGREDFFTHFTSVRIRQNERLVEFTY